MATVQDLLDLFDDKLLPYKAAFDSLTGGAEAGKIRALDAGKEKIWQVVVGSSQKAYANWFAKSGSLSYASGDNTEDLPTDFHSLLSAESSSVQMRPSAFHKQEWRADRNESGNVDVATLEALYYVIGGNASGLPALLLSRKPNATLAVSIQYTARIATWTAAGDNIDDFPVPLYDAVANYAVHHLLGAAQDPAMAAFWSSVLEVDRALIAGITDGRQFGGMVSADDLDSAG